MSPYAKVRGKLRAALADPDPILLKELRVSLRTPRFIRFLWLSTGVLGLIVLTLASSLASSGEAPASVGRALYQTFFSLAIVLLTIAAPAYAAGAITNERAEKTLENLLLTGMSPRRIVRGKMLASVSSLALVIVAIGPIVGIAFLFGGVSPVQVLVAFYALLALTVVAVSFGVAASANLGTTRQAVSVVTMLSLMATLFGSGALAALGSWAESRWQLSSAGPMWFAEAITLHFTEPEVFVQLVLLPHFVGGMALWFFMLTAAAGIQGRFEDRSSGYKLWATVLVLGCAVVAFGVVASGSWGSVDDLLIFFAGTTLSLQIFLGLLFGGEHVIVMQRGETESTGFSIRRVLGRIWGPGLASTYRFGLALICLSSLLMAIAVLAGMERFGGFLFRVELVRMGVITIALETIAIGAATLGFTGLVMSRLHRALASRFLAALGLFVLTLGPIFVSLLVGELDLLEDAGKYAPIALGFMPVHPLMVASGVARSGNNVEPMAMVGALFFYVPVAILCGLAALRRAGRQVATFEAQRKALQAERASSTPPPQRPLGEVLDEVET